MWNRCSLPRRTGWRRGWWSFRWLLFLLYRRDRRTAGECAHERPDLQLDCRRRQFPAAAGLPVARSGVTAIYGSSGGGKSTLLDCIAGLRRPEPGGLIRFQGEDWLSPDLFVPWLRRGIRVPGFRLFPHLDVKQNLALRQPPLPRQQRHEHATSGALAGTGGNC